MYGGASLKCNCGGVRREHYILHSSSLYWCFCLFCFIFSPYMPPSSSVERILFHIFLFLNVFNKHLLHYYLRTGLLRSALSSFG